MTDRIPCGLEDDRCCLPEDGHETPLPKYRNNNHRAAIEDCPLISIVGLTIMWGNWAEFNPSALPKLLHGAKMVLELPYLSDEYAEIDFLEDIAAYMPVDDVDYK
jgi:hypothetical protein